ETVFRVPVFEQGTGHGCDIRPAKLAPSFHQLPDLVDVPALSLLLLDGVEQSRRGFLLRCSDGKEVTAVPPASVIDVGNLVVPVKPEVPSRLAIGRVQDRVFDDDGIHWSVESGSLNLLRVW